MIKHSYTTAMCIYHNSIFQLLKRWLGQMVEALCFVHDRKVIHRDLKPSNIFMKDDLSISIGWKYNELLCYIYTICIGDFGVATVMGDIRTMTRTAVGMAISCLW